MPTHLWQLFPNDATEEALSPDAFQATQYFEYPDPPWWKLANPARDADSRAPRYPTRAKYWTAYPIERLRSTVPLPGEPTARAKRRAVMARSFTARAREHEKRQGSRRWRLILESVVEAVTSERGGSNEVWRGETKSPYQSITRGKRLSESEIDGLYYQLVRATVRATTGLGTGPSGLTTDARHGPDWYSKLAVNQGLREALNEAGIDYENSVAYADRVTLEITGP
jgi:hypothetical protein